MKKGKLTESMKASYVKHGGSFCPSCGRDMFEGGFVNVEAGHAFQECVCLDCGFRWVDTYTLTSIEEVQGAWPS